MLLQSANLMQYENVLIGQGADDVQQLVELSEDEFQNLLQLVGMSEKPFHVMRFRKVLGRQVTPPNNQLLVDNSNTHTVTVYANQIDDAVTCTPTLSTTPSVTQQTAPIQPSPFPPGNPLSHFSYNGDQPSLNITPQQLQELVDDSVIVQKHLKVSPIDPGIWDSGRREVIRNASQIFAQSSKGGQLKHMTEHELLMNEAAFHLCLWDPTLLVRKEELFTLSKKLVRTFFPSGAIDIKYPPDTNKRSSRSKGSLPYPVNRGPDGKFQSCFETNYVVREKQLKDVERLIVENAAEEQVKQGLLVEAKQKKDYSSALKLQEEITALGQHHRDLKQEMSRLKKKQKRAIRNQEIKTIKQRQENGINITPTFLPSPTSLDSDQSNSSSSVTLPPNSLLPIPPLEVGTSSSTAITDTPLQLHTYTQDSIMTPTQTTLIN